MTRLLPCLLLLVALAAPAGASAADPIEGGWLVDGTTVVVSPSQGAFHGVAVAQSPVSACVSPGTEVWSSITGTSPYNGKVNLFSPETCALTGTADATFSLAGPGAGALLLCVSGAPCQVISRPAQCGNTVDDDGDGDVDTADPGCDGAADTTEAPDPTIQISDQTLYEASGQYSSLSISLSPPSSRPVTVNVSVTPGSAQTPSDFLPLSASPLQLFPGQPGTTFALTVVPDGVAEPSETFTVNLASPSGARLGRSAATITIVDAGAGRSQLDNEPNATSRNRRTTSTRDTSGGSEVAAENRAICGIKPPIFQGRPKSGKDGRQRCPKARPKARRARGGSAGVDRMTGNGRANALAGLGGNDTLRGLGGGDRLAGGRGNDNIWGGSGGDALEGGDGDDRMYGGAGSDWLVELGYGDDRLDGGPGDDVIAGNNGVDRINGGPGDDIISGGSGPDTVNCGAGYDTLYWNLVSDRARSRNCERFLEEADIRQRSCGQGGTGAAEQVRGGSGRDTCRGRGGDDVLEGAGGSDRLYGDAGNDTLFGRKGSELMYGGAGDDVLEGGQGADRMYGGPGSDVLNGGFGRDRLSGGPGNDTLNAGFGDRGEIVDCGPGRDTYVYGPGDKPRNCEVTRR